jgi:hypothetical protein
MNGSLSPPGKADSREVCSCRWILRTTPKRSYARCDFGGPKVGAIVSLREKRIARDQVDAGNVTAQSDAIHISGGRYICSARNGSSNPFAVRQTRAIRSIPLSMQRAESPCLPLVNKSHQVFRSTRVIVPRFSRQRQKTPRGMGTVMATSVRPAGTGSLVPVPCRRGNSPACRRSCRPRRASGA